MMKNEFNPWRLGRQLGLSLSSPPLSLKIFSSRKIFPIAVIVVISFLLPTKRNICFSLLQQSSSTTTISSINNNKSKQEGHYHGIKHNNIVIKDWGKDDDNRNSNSKTNRPQNYRGRSFSSEASSRRNVLATVFIPFASSSASIISQVIALPPAAQATSTAGETSSSSPSDFSPSSEEGTSSSRNRGGKPFAPLSALLPATRLKIIVDQMYELSLNLKNTNDKSDKQYQILVQMNEIWTSRPPLFQKNDNNQQRSSNTRTPGSTAQLTTGISSANKRQYKELRKDLSIPDRMAAILNQADVERQWGMIQYQESKREQSSQERAAFNVYTSQLNYADSYVLTASPSDRKRLIRNDELPTLTAVITSDLDLRDLYRNDFLTAIEDVVAEISYQINRIGQEDDDIDVMDVIELMEQAHTSIAKWFDLISPIDVQEAMDHVVVREERNEMNG